MHRTDNQWETELITNNKKQNWLPMMNRTNNQWETELLVNNDKQNWLPMINRTNYQWETELITLIIYLTVFVVLCIIEINKQTNKPSTNKTLKIKTTEQTIQYTEYKLQHY